MVSQHPNKYCLKHKANHASQKNLRKKYLFLNVFIFFASGYLKTTMT